MVKRDLVVINAVTEILELKKNRPSELDETIIKAYLENNKNLLKTEKEMILAIKSVNLALKIKKENSKKTTKEIAQQILNN